MLNLFIIYSGHLKSSKKSLMISMIGLIFAIAIISSSLMYINSAKVDIIESVLNNRSPYEVEIEIQTLHTNISFSTLFSEIKDLGSEVINIINLKFFENLELFFSIHKAVIPKLNFIYNKTTNLWDQIILNRSLIILELNNDIREDLNIFLNASSSLPSIDNETIPQAFMLDVYSEDIPQANVELNLIEKNDVSNYSQYYPIDIYSQSSNISQMLSFNISGYGKFITHNKYFRELHGYSINYNEETFPTLSKVWKLLPKSMISSYLFVQNLTNVITLFQPLFFDNQTNITDYGIKAYINGGYKINYDKFDPFTIASKIEEIKALQTTIKDKIFDTDFFKNLNTNIGSTYLNVRFINYSKLNNVLQIIFNIIYEMFLYALPMLIIALLVTNYSFGLIQRKILSHIGIYKTRGANALLLFVFQLLDYLIIILGSTFVGMIAGIPISGLVLKTDSILSFNNSKNYDVTTNFLTILPYLVILLFILSVLIGFLTSSRKIIRISKMTVQESEIALENIEPFWKKHNIDVYLFLYGFLSYLIILYLINSSTDNSSIIQAGFIFLIFFIPGPFAIVIGTILISNRVIPNVLEKIGSKIWIKSGGILAFSFKNVIRHKQSSTRGIILISSLITFLILFYTTPFSQLNFENKVSQYELGGEAQIKFTEQEPGILKNRIDYVSNFLNNSFSKDLKGSSSFLKIRSFSNNYPLTVLFIDSKNFLNASSISLYETGLKNNLHEDLAKLQNIETNYSVILPKSFSNLAKYSIGEQIALEIFNYIEIFTVVDSYDQWPQTSRNKFDLYDNYIILDINYFYDTFINNSAGYNFYFEIEAGILLKFENLTNISEVVRNISQQTGNEIVEAKITFENWNIESKLIFKFRLGQINIDIIISLLISVSILLMFAYMQMNDRKKELFTERALGMKLHQIAFIFYVESIILLISGFVIGSIISIYFMESLTIFLSGGLSIPPYEIIIPFDLVLLTYIILFVVASLCSIIPGYYLSKQDIAKSFITDA
jgi:ABC-type antimicrobial peptide transport system permease subunit